MIQGRGNERLAHICIESRSRGTKEIYSIQIFISQKFQENVKKIYKWAFFIDLQQLQITKECIWKIQKRYFQVSTQQRKQCLLWSKLLLVGFSYPWKCKSCFRNVYKVYKVGFMAGQICVCLLVKTNGFASSIPGLSHILCQQSDICLETLPRNGHS